MRRASGTAWAGVGWCAGVLALLLGIPLAASGRLPDRLATHWGTGGEPDGSMPLWAAALFPALIWLILVLAVLFWTRRSHGAARGWTGVSLASGGVFLVGVQASVVRANLDRSDWHEADSVTPWVMAAVVAAVTAGAFAFLATRHPAPGQRQTPGPGMSIPPDQQLAWFSRTSNQWLLVTAAVTGFAAVALTAAGVGGLLPLHAALIAPFAFASLAVLGCSSVQVRVSERGMKVSFGPLGWPARHWAVQDIESARVEHRTPAQVGGWGYRLSGLGTTVMLRGGECLVVRAKGKDFAVSVDDAERGAGLLNALSAETSGRHPS
ncbi:DUF1648 domain-containing protein [Streptomyces sp. NPDC050732]|uniref:DUF1648 domain-containing protein n=1 Tax=Streptomyces sp. NPDC050732 TaxID=3154632 RepID=UPI00342E229F